MFSKLFSTFIALVIHSLSLDDTSSFLLLPTLLLFRCDVIFHLVHSHLSTLLYLLNFKFPPQLHSLSLRSLFFYDITQALRVGGKIEISQLRMPQERSGRRRRAMRILNFSLLCCVILNILIINNCVCIDLQRTIGISSLFIDEIFSPFILSVTLLPFLACFTCLSTSNF